MTNEKYISLRSLAGRLNLPPGYVKREALTGNIPHLVIGGKLTFQEAQVREALSELAKSHTSPSPTSLFAQLYLAERNRDVEQFSHYYATLKRIVFVGLFRGAKDAG